MILLHSRRFYVTHYIEKAGDGGTTCYRFTPREVSQHLCNIYTQTIGESDQELENSSTSIITAISVRENNLEDVENKKKNNRKLKENIRIEIS